MMQRISRNFDLHALTLPSRTRGMEVFYSPSLTRVDSNIPCDTFNIVHITNGQSLTRDELNDALNHFKKKDSPFCIWISDEQLTDHVKSIFSVLGVSEKKMEPGMILDLSSYHPAGSELHKNINVVTSKMELNDYAEVIAVNWTPPDQNVIQYYNQAADNILDNSKNMFVVCYINNEAVSVLEMFPSDDETIGLYGLATRLNFRGRGIGSAMMTFSLNKALALGYKYIILQASEDGIGIYKRFGFKVVTRYYEYA